jgi:hypothetical protein
VNERGPKMNILDAAAFFSALGPDEKASFLALLAHELTVVARDTYEVGGEGLTNPARMRAVNEVQHRLMSFLVALLSGDPRRYPDDILVRIVLENPGDAVLQRQLAAAFGRAMSLVGATASQEGTSEGGPK